MRFTAFVSGATGFIGSHLCERLIARGHSVTALVRRTSDRHWVHGLPLRTVEADLSNDDGLAWAVKGAQVVFHLAGLTRAHSEAEYLAGNQLTTRRLIEAVRQAGEDVKRFLFVSSLAAAGPGGAERPMVETDPPRPISFYGSSKLAAEREVLAAGPDLPATVVRPPATYGPRDRNLLTVLRSAKRGWAILPNHGRGLASLIHVYDLVDGMILAATHPEAVGQTYYLSGQAVTWSQVSDTLEGIVGRRLRHVNLPPMALKMAAEFSELKWLLTGRPQVVSRRKIKDILQPAWVCSDEKARRELGYRPQVSLAEGLAGTYRWYEEQGWI
jgi:dihydroflavonol-4-reductase